MLKRILYWPLMIQVVGILCTVVYVWCGDVSLKWDVNEPTPEGYRVFATTSSESFDYDNPVWEGVEVETVVTIPDSVEYIFCVRAFNGETESGDSNWIYCTKMSLDNLQFMLQVSRSN